MDKEKLKAFEMFSGFGCASHSLKQLGLDYEVIGHSEIDKFAIKCFEQNHPNIKNYGDCTKIDEKELPEFDLLTAGFPCQSFSIAGKRGGFDDTRGTLIYDVLRIAKYKKPKYMLLENVRGLLSHEEGRTFKTILKAIREIGYGVIYKVINSADLGVPQNRERIWFVCKLNDWEFGEFVFPFKKRVEYKIKDLLETNVDKKYYISQKKRDMILRNDVYINFNRKRFNTLTAGQYKMGKGACTNLLADFRYDEGLRIRTSEKCPALTCRGGGGSVSGGVYNVENIRTDKKLYEDVIQNVKIRRLTPRETFRLQGFVNDEININNISDTQLYRLSGNGWDKNVATRIFEQMFKHTKYMKNE